MYMELTEKDISVIIENVTKDVLDQLESMKYHSNILKCTDLSENDVLGEWFPYRDMPIMSITGEILARTNTFQCSFCQSESYRRSKFCPNCGRRMNTKSFADCEGT